MKQLRKTVPKEKDGDWERKGGKTLTDVKPVENKTLWNFKKDKLCTKGTPSFA